MERINPNQWLSRLWISLLLLAVGTVPIKALLLQSPPSRTSRHSSGYSEAVSCDRTFLRSSSTSSDDADHSSNRNSKSTNPTATTKQHPKLEKPRIPILQYHNHWVCINKPAQMTVHRSKDSARRRDFVVASLLKRQLRRKVFPVHRLDHRTSGALLFAFDAATCAQLHASLTHKDESTVKDYVALLRGDWRDLPNVVTVDQPINIDGTPKEALTEFHLLAQLETPDANEQEREYKGACSLVLCRPQTGRKHQIRRHAFAFGHPILGDSEHGDSRVNRWWRQNRDLDRLFLHCLSLDLPPPIEHNASADEDDDLHDKDRIQCIAPLAPELSKVLQRHDMADVWKIAVGKDPRLALEPYDERGGTLGRGAVKRKRAAAEAEAKQQQAKAQISENS